MTTLENAIAIAAKAHAGQTDNGGAPYILHPLRVMMKLSEPKERIVAVLHDVVEDSPVTFNDLRQAGFDEEVIEAVRALTKLPGESRMDAAQRARRNPIARRVKLADVGDNMDPSRIGAMTAKDEARMAQYRQVKAFLEAA